MTLLQDLNNAKHISIKFDKNYLASATALYTYILQLHKKVSLVCLEKIDERFLFLPWFDKIRNSDISSADLKVDLKLSAIDLYKLFEENGIKLNQKMATSLYAGLLLETDGFKNDNVNGMTFAIAKQLLDAKAEYKVCTKFILKTSSLAYLRLKSLMLKNMILTNDATVATINIDDDNLKSSGAKIDDAYEILKDVLTLPYVKEVLLIKKENKEILKIIKEI